MTIQEQEQFLQSILTHDEYRYITDHHVNMILYLAGITQFKKLDKAIMRRAIGIKETATSKVVELSVESFQFLYETQDVRSILNIECCH